jgi:hypothetical protein
MAKLLVVSLANRKPDPEEYIDSAMESSSRSNGLEAAQDVKIRIQTAR